MHQRIGGAARAASATVPRRRVARCRPAPPPRHGRASRRDVATTSTASEDTTRECLHLHEPPSAGTAARLSSSPALVTRENVQAHCTGQQRRRPPLRMRRPATRDPSTSQRAEHARDELLRRRLAPRAPSSSAAVAPNVRMNPASRTSSGRAQIASAAGYGQRLPRRTPVIDQPRAEIEHRPSTSRATPRRPRVTICAYADEHDQRDERRSAAGHVRTRSSARDDAPPGWRCSRPEIAMTWYVPAACSRSRISSGSAVRSPIRTAVTIAADTRLCGATHRSMLRRTCGAHHRQSPA